jgi:anti-anti-sigma regulatory factor
MAANFHIHKSRKQRRLDVTLSGDFDGSSAAQLANVLERNRDRYATICIVTDGIACVNAFGCQVLRARLMGHKWASRQCRFCGKFAGPLGEQLPTAKRAA